MMFKRFEVKKTVEIKGLYTFFSETYEKGFYFDGESHDFYEVVCVTDGQAGITSDSSAFVLHCGQAVVHAPGVFHKIWTAGDGKTSVVIFSFDGFVDLPKDSIVFELGKGINEIIRLAAEKKRIFVPDDICFEDVKPKYKAEQSLFVNYLENFLVKLICNSSESVSKTKNEEDYSKIIEILEENVERTLSLSEVAELSCMSCPKLKKIFSRYSGMGVMSYFNSMKMRRAEELLRNGMSVKETAYKLGFSDQNYFSYAFKKYMGKSPKLFKQT